VSFEECGVGELVVRGAHDRTVTSAISPR
jgi:hypothetical protein